MKAAKNHREGERQNFLEQGVGKTADENKGVENIRSRSNSNPVEKTATFSRRGYDGLDFTEGQMVLAKSPRDIQ